MPWYFNPVIAEIGPLTLRWYGLMYALGFGMAWYWIQYSRIGKSLELSTPQKETLLMSLILGVLLGGRLGYVFFYNFSYYWSEPLKTLAVWEGGMSFHGGLLGVAMALLWFARSNNVSLWKLADTASSIAPLGLLIGRLGNFINGELYGRIAAADEWSQRLCLHFPSDPENCRYPTQLFESFLEGLVLFFILFVLARRTERPGALSAAFLFFYGLFRFIIEFWREPDPQLGFLLGDFLTMGMLFSLAMMVAGLGVGWNIFRNK